MKNVVYIIAFVVSLSCFSSTSYAQFLGSLETQQEESDPSAAPVAKIFSSKVVSVIEARKLDVIYDELKVSLWNLASTDFAHQSKLNEIIEPQRFKLTRYAAEFDNDLNAALKVLNEQSAAMKNEIKHANDQYQKIRDGVISNDYEILDALWAEKIKSFEALSERYFKMQFAYLKVYKNLVKFILQEAGSYYYNTAASRVDFYDVAAYQYYVKSLDRMNKISYEQRKLLRSDPPANIDPTIIQ